jgi:hypothetical protein
MSRRRYIWDAERACLVEVTSDYTGQRRDEGRRSEAEVYGHCQATDGTDLSTRTRHREYMRQNGLTVASDYTETWAKAGEERKAALTPGSGHDSRQRMEDLGRARQEVLSRRRARR